MSLTHSCVYFFEAKNKGLQSESDVMETLATCSVQLF